VGTGTHRSIKIITKSAATIPSIPRQSHLNIFDNNLSGALRDRGPRASDRNRLFENIVYPLGYCVSDDLSEICEAACITEKLTAQKLASQLTGGLHFFYPIPAKPAWNTRFHAQTQATCNNANIIEVARFCQYAVNFISM
jgi:hypothetical protein